MYYGSALTGQVDSLCEISLVMFLELSLQISYSYFLMLRFLMLVTDCINAHVPVDSLHVPTCVSSQDANSLTRFLAPAGQSCVTFS